MAKNMHNKQVENGSNPLPSRKRVGHLDFCYVVNIRTNGGATPQIASGLCRFDSYNRQGCRIGANPIII